MITFAIVYFVASMAFAAVFAFAAWQYDRFIRRARIARRVRQIAGQQ